MILPLIIIKSLIRNIERSRTTVLHIALCISVIVASFSLINGYEISFALATKSYATSNTILVKNSTTQSPIRADVLPSFSSIPHIESKQIVGDLNISSHYFRDNNNSFYGVNVSEFLRIHEFRIINGTYNISSVSVFVGARFAFYNAINVGTNLTLKSKFFEWNVTVVGILDFNSPMDYAIFLNLPLARVFTKMATNYYSQIEIFVFNLEDVHDVISELQSINGIIIYHERALSQIILDIVHQISLSLWAMAFILFILSMALIYQAANNLIRSAKYEIGLLISMGTSRISLILLLLIQIIGIGLIASVTGISIGIVLSNIMSYISSLFGDQLYAPSMPTIGLIGDVISVSFIFTLIGGIIPILLLMKKSPGELLQ